MSRLEDKLNQKAADLADLKGKDDKLVAAIGGYALKIVILFALIFATSIYGIMSAETNAGQGVGWFAAIVSGILFLAALWSWLGVLWEQFKRRS